MATLILVLMVFFSTTYFLTGTILNVMKIMKKIKDNEEN